MKSNQQPRGRLRPDAERRLGGNPTDGHTSDRASHSTITRNSSEPAAQHRTTPPLRLAYSLDEVMQLVPIGRTSLFLLIADGSLPTITIGRRRFVTAAALEAFATAGTP